MKTRKIIITIMAMAGLMLFGVGMCMSVLTDWTGYNPDTGLIAAAAGTVVFAVSAMLRRGLVDKPKEN